uniref:(+)-neomenthol dehydrogenase n=1 Tax=Anthurium amnicola TaxID=1678845 RepID=A0A1D1Y5H9_9ARAE
MEANREEQPNPQRVAVVTGANKGIGLEVVRQLALEGVTVVLTARDEKRGTDAVESLRRSGLPNVVFHQLDIRDPAGAAALAEFVRTRFGKLDILVNNAGIGGVTVDVEGFRSLNIDPRDLLSGKATHLVQGVMKQTYEDAEACIDTNYYGCKRVTEALLPLLHLSPGGARIVNVSSVLSRLKMIPSESIRRELGDVDHLDEEMIDGVLRRFLEDFKRGELESGGWGMLMPANSISKAAMNAYTRLVARRWPRMCVNCVHPGYVDTDINSHNGVLPVEEGARGPVMLALLPLGGPSGCYFDQTTMAGF